MFWEDSCTDFDIRFPESRRRRLVELQILHQEKEVENLEKLLKSYKLTSEKISAFDWDVLFEWNERCLQAHLQSEAERELLRLKEAGPSEVDERRLVVQSLQKELEVILETTLRSRLPHHPYFWDLLLIRWRMAPLRRQAEYYHSRIRALVPPS